MSRDKYREYHQRWRDNNRERYKVYYTSFRDRFPQASMVSAARRRARKFKVPFDLTKEDLVVPKKCPVLGIPLFKGVGGKSIDNSPSLDRIIPSLGYVRSNVVVISNLANRIKSNATASQIQKVALWLKKKEQRKETS